MTEGDGVSIVLITPENAALLERVAEDVFDDGVSRIAEYANAPLHGLFVALAEGVVIGQVRGVVHVQPDLPRQLYIDNLGVAPAWQRRGVARRLMLALLDWGRAQGCADVWVATEIDNEEAKAFYAALGFEGKTLAWYSADL